MPTPGPERNFGPKNTLHQPVTQSTWKALLMETYDPHKNTTEVRQGSRRTMNLRALLIGLALLVVAFAVIYFVYAGQPTTPTTN